MPESTHSSLLFLVGLCRESQRTLAGAAAGAREARFRAAFLDAFDQRGQMLDDLERLAPEAGRGEAMQVGWRPFVVGNGDDVALLATCIAGEEATLRTAQTLWAESADLQVRQVLQMHILRVSTLLAGFRTINSR